MKRLAIALALFASPLAAARPANLVGHYALQGAAGTDSELEITSDGQFEWYQNIGEVDLFAEGSWNAVGDTIILTAKTDSKAPPPGFETLKLQIKDGRLVPPDGRGGYAKAVPKP